MIPKQHRSRLFGGVRLADYDIALISKLMKEHEVELGAGFDEKDMYIWKEYPIMKVWLTYGEAGHHQEVPKDEATTVEVFMTPAPAQFWKALIRPGKDQDGKPYDVTTGSGRLEDFWPMFYVIAQNMLVPVEVEA